MSAVEITVLDATAAKAAIDELADVLVDCVEGGASVSFMLPFSHSEARAFFSSAIFTSSALIRADANTRARGGSSPASSAINSPISASVNPAA